MLIEKEGAVYRCRKCDEPVTGRAKFEHMSECEGGEADSEDEDGFPMSVASCSLSSMPLTLHRFVLPVLDIDLRDRLVKERELAGALDGDVGDEVHHRVASFFDPRPDVLQNEQTTEPF